MTTIKQQEQVSAELAASLQSMLDTILTKTLSSQVVDKHGKPTGSACYMMLPSALAVGADDVSSAWMPAGTDTASSLTGSGAAAPGSTTPTVDKTMAHAIQSAANISALVDTMLSVTDNGSYVASESQFQLSSAYEAILAKAQGLPAPPLPADLQKKVDAARSLLWVFDAQGNNTGVQTPLFSSYESLSTAWSTATANYAVAEAQASGDPALAGVWPVQSKALKVAVDNAWNDWRSSGADQIENALDVLGSVGGALGAHLVSEGRKLLQTWDIGLSGAVPANTYYSYVLPSSFWDPTNKQTGFTTVTVSSKTATSSGSAAAKSLSASWYQAHSSSTSAGGNAMIFGVCFGGSGGSTSQGQAQGWSASSANFSAFSSKMSNVTISFEYGMCTVHRPWLLTALFAADGWYLPGARKGAVSTGQIKDQIGATNPHLLPMIPTQFLVVRNVKLTADNWGESGTQLAKQSAAAQSSSQGSSVTGGGSVGFLCFGAQASHTEAQRAGQGSKAGSGYSAWKFSGSATHGTLSIPGAQIVGWVGQIVPISPKMDSPAVTPTR